MNQAAPLSLSPAANGLPDPETCRRARLSRDPRFDGEFFLAVRTTGIYCRPVCPARPPAERNVQYFREASQAAEAGYRPCLRCRPEAAPGSPAWRGSATTVNRALGLIQAGALNETSVSELASRLGVGERYLRKLFQRELGISPQAVAHNRRLLFARQLLLETGLSITDVAFAAGFGSVRRFNSAVRDSFGAPPSALRRRASDSSPGRITLQLHYRPPYDWEGVMDFFARHAVPGVEEVCAAAYRRQLDGEAGAGELYLRPLPGRHALALELTPPDISQLMQTVARVRRMFDLDANPAVIADTLGQDARLATLLARYPGIRSPVYWSATEASVRAIVGQQVSIDAARTLCGRLAAAGGSGRQGFPPAAAVASLADSDFAMPARRRECLRAACRLLAPGEPDDLLARLNDLPGIGPWTLSMVAMRGLGDPDTFPHRDLGLLRAWEALAPDAAPVEQAARHWRPFRAYAANLLWRSL